MNDCTLPLPKLALTSFMPCRNGLIRGYAAINLPEVGIEIRNVSLLSAEADWWVLLPTSPTRDQDGQPRRRDTGALAMKPSVSIAGLGRWKRFQQAVVALIREAHPEVFEQPRDDPAPAFPAFVREAAA